MPSRSHSKGESNGKLVNQLTTQLHDLTGPNCTILLKRERPWASITFSGTRHLFEIDCAAGDAERIRQKLEESLPEHEFDLTGYFVADALVEAAPDHAGPDEQLQTVCIDILTITDPVS